MKGRGKVQETRRDPTELSITECRHSSSCQLLVLTGTNTKGDTTKEMQPTMKETQPTAKGIAPEHVGSLAGSGPSPAGP